MLGTLELVLPHADQHLTSTSVSAEVYLSIFEAPSCPCLCFPFVLGFKPAATNYFLRQNQTDSSKESDEAPAFEVEAAHAYARGSTTINKRRGKRRINSIQMQNMRTKSAAIKATPVSRKTPREEDKKLTTGCR